MIMLNTFALCGTFSTTVATVSIGLKVQELLLMLLMQRCLLQCTYSCM